MRVLVNGTEKEGKVIVNASEKTIQEPIDGVQKYHVMFSGMFIGMGRYRFTINKLSPEDVRDDHHKA